MHSGHYPGVRQLIHYNVDHVQGRPERGFHPSHAVFDHLSLSGPFHFVWNLRSEPLNTLIRLAGPHGRLLSLVPDLDFFQVWVRIFYEFNYEIGKNTVERRYLYNSVCYIALHYRPSLSSSIAQNLGYTKKRCSKNR